MPVRLISFNDCSNNSFVILSVAVVDDMTSEYPLLSVSDYRLLTVQSKIFIPDAVYIPSEGMDIDHCLNAYDENLNRINEMSPH